MGWLRAVGSALSRLVLAVLFGRVPKTTASAEAWWMACYGDTPTEKAEGAELVILIDALPFNGPGHCRESWEEHRTYWKGRLDRAQQIDSLSAPSGP
jgi:hypothetical protein